MKNLICKILISKQKTLLLLLSANYKKNSEKMGGAISAGGVITINIEPQILSPLKEAIG